MEKSQRPNETLRGQLHTEKWHKKFKMYIDTSMHIDTSNFKEFITLSEALKEIDKLRVETFIGFTNYDFHFIQFVRESMDNWLLDIPYIQYMENSSKYFNFENLTTEIVKDLVEEFWEDPDLGIKITKKALNETPLKDNGDGEYYDTKILNFFQKSLQIANVKSLYEQGLAKFNKQNYEEARELFKKAVSIECSRQDMKFRKEIKFKLSKCEQELDQIHITEINSIITQADQQKREHNQSITLLNDALSKVKEINNYAKKNDQTKMIKDLIQQTKIAKIKNTILTLGTQFARLQIIEIVEEVNEREDLIILTVKEMISNDEIYAKYFDSTKSVAFNLQSNLAEIDNLMDQYKKWEMSGNGKK